MGYSGKIGRRKENGKMMELSLNLIIKVISKSNMKI